jgi:hypothetical protein
MLHVGWVLGGKACVCNLSPATTMADLKIFVVILGEAPASRKMFAVRASGDMDVDEWRQQVHATAKSRLKGVAAIDLELWKVRPLYSLHRPMY